MKGVVFLGDRKLELREFPDPTPGPRDVILAIKASGLCGSDLHTYRAPPNPGGVVTGGIKRAAGVIAGHEPCGVVAAVGTAVTDKETRIGQRVMDHHYDGCGNCKHCRAGWTQMCLEGTVVYGSGGHGGHAKYMKVPASTLVPLPDALSFVTGAAISCGTGTAWGALRRIQLQGGETIAIFGQGPVGLSATQLAVEMGARVIAIDIAPERRKLAQQFGAAEVIDPTAHDTVAAIRELTHGEGAHKTLDASSAPDARAAAVRSVGAWCAAGQSRARGSQPRGSTGAGGSIAPCTDGAPRSVGECCRDRTQSSRRANSCRRQVACEDCTSCAPPACSLSLTEKLAIFHRAVLGLLEHHHQGPWSAQKFFAKLGS